MSAPIVKPIVKPTVSSPINDSNIFIELNKLSDNLICTMPNEIKNILKTRMYNYQYLYTLEKFKDILTSKAIETILNSPENRVSNIDNSIEQYLIYKINKEYRQNIKDTCTTIAAIPSAEQKSPEWFKQREGLISASDAGYFLKTCGAGKALDTLKIKVGLKFYASSNAKPLVHGNTYEDVARGIYESRHGVVVSEYGLLSSRVNCIGASPDGIVTDVKLTTFDAISRYGRLIEIKNPYSREIDEHIKPDYMIQILQQQFTTQIPICDFVEATIVDVHCNTLGMANKPYRTLDEMLADCLDLSKPAHIKRIKNTNIPQSNLNKFGNEKGFVVSFNKVITEGDVRNKYVMYPLDAKYEKAIIENWINDLVNKLGEEKWCKTGVRYWRLDVYSEKTVVYDEVLYESSYVPHLQKVWSVIEKCREIKANKGKLSEYIDNLPSQSESPFYNDSLAKKKNISKRKITVNDSDSAESASETAVESPSESPKNCNSNVLYDI